MELLSTFASNLNLRRYISELGDGQDLLFRCAKDLAPGMVGPCKLTVSELELIARLLSAPETKLR